MKIKPKGSIHRGSVIHQILTELERYPMSWYQSHQFPTVTAQDATVRRMMQRLIKQRKVTHRLVMVNKCTAVGHAPSGTVTTAPSCL